MSLKIDNSLLVVIDIQDKLLPAMNNMEQIKLNTIKLINGIDVFNIPKLVTEQYPKGLGRTIAEIQEILGKHTLIEKTTFSCYKNDDFIKALKDNNRKNIILCGIETHICVEQTAIDLIENGYNVYLVCDCVGSRNDFNTDISINKLAKIGVILTTYESVLYSILEDAKSPFFKQISSIVK